MCVWECCFGSHHLYICPTGAKVIAYVIVSLGMRLDCMLDVLFAHGHMHTHSLFSRYLQHSLYYYSPNAGFHVIVFVYVGR